MKTLLLISFILLSGCGDDKFSRVEELQGFRILGVIATAPEVAPNGMSDLQLIVSDQSGGGRVITGTTQSCIDPGISFGANVSCAHDPATVNGTYTIDMANDADLGSANLYTGVAAQIVSVIVPATIFLGRSARSQFNGVGYITIFNFQVDGKNISTFKRVTATNRVANTNPSISDVFLNGSPLTTTKPDKDDKLKVAVSAPETYTFENVDGSQEVKTEEQAVAWYVSYGEFDKPKSEVEEDVKYLSNSPGSTMVVVTLVRDERGGIALQRIVLP